MKQVRFNLVAVASVQNILTPMDYCQLEKTEWNHREGVLKPEM